MPAPRAGQITSEQAPDRMIGFRAFALILPPG
jgi:hypothetical protein